MAFRYGIDKVQESAQRGGGSGARTRFINWKPGETKTIRFLTEGDLIVLTYIHEWVTTHDGGHQSFICRREIEVDGKAQHCELCDSGTKRREIAYAVAVEREPAKKDGKTVFVTKTTEADVEVDGKTVTKTVPVVGIIRQAPKNFWGWFYEVFEKEGTLVNRDFSVTRRGEKLDTNYQPYPEDRQELDASKFEEYMPDLEGFLTRLASEEFYAKFLHGVDTKTEEDASSSDVTLTKEDLARLENANQELVQSASSGEFD